MERLENVHIEGYEVLPSPDEIKKALPLSDAAAESAGAGRHAVEAVLSHRDPRHMLIVGPCSVHNADAAREYARRLVPVAREVSSTVLVVMRVYVEKPRTTVGWKGMIYDPGLDDSCDIARGLRLSRRLMLDIAEMGLPIASEVLDPVMPQYLADLIAWGVIGARTTESQTHRQLASGLSMPVGFKNPTNGSVRTALEAIKTAAAPHSFLGVTSDGRSGFFRTSGNKYCHLVLRGGSGGPNYGGEHVAFARVLMKKMGIEPAIVVDCSHANSGKSAERQGVVLRDVIGQVTAGENAIVGSMIESNLKSGRQDVRDPAMVAPDISITDECIGWEETEKLIRWMHETLSRAR